MKVESIVVDGWENVESGLVLAENEEWILVKHIPVDYLVDGYRLYKKAFVKDRLREEEEIKIEKVLELKGVEETMPEDFTFSNTLGLLAWVEERYGLFEFQDQDETEVYYGKKKGIEDDMLIIDSIDPDGVIDSENVSEFQFREIRAITFESDYHWSIQLLYEENQRSISFN